MAADQRKKKRVAASLAGCTSHEKYGLNAKKLHVHHHDLNTRPNISLEWDSRKKSVVSRKEQIGFSKRHLIPFIEPGSRGHNFLADVLPVPLEIFELDNLSEVLSYEVWKSYLSDNERSFLSQFLPKGVQPDKTVQDLLSGDNLHFGNPSMRWSDSLCRGELHPDNVLHEEQSLKAAKKGYYSFLENYHSDMVENLQMWKEKWSSCMDAGVDSMQNIWSSRKHGEKPMLASDARFWGTEENCAATPDSCSWEKNSEIAYSSENQNLGTVQGESHRRKEFLKKKSDSSSSGRKVLAAAHRKVENLHQWNIQQNDGAKYMSYIKVSKQQHERVKNSIKHAGNSIQPRSLNNVLGSFDALNVQPFARFEEEECKKLHEYWVKLATKDILVGFASWRNRQLQRQELRQFLGEEIEQKVELKENTLDEEKDASSSNRMELLDGEGELPPSDTVEEVKKEQINSYIGCQEVKKEQINSYIDYQEVKEEQSEDLLLEQNCNEESIHEMATEIEDQKKIRNNYIFEKRTSNCREMNEDEDAPNHVFIQDHSEPEDSSLNNSPRSTMITSPTPGFRQDQHQHQQQISSLDSNPHTNSVETESHGDSGSTKDEDPQIVSGYSENMNHVDVPLSQGTPLPSSSDVWAVSDVHGSYYQPTASNSGYASTHEMSVGHPQLMQGQMLDLQTNRSDKDARNRQTEDMSFFSSYSNPDRSELLHSLLKGQSNLSYHEPPKLAGLEFQARNDLVMETGNFSGHLREHVHPSSSPMDLRQKRLNDLYAHQNIQESIYSGSRFRQEEFPVNVHDWATSVNNVRLPVPCQPHLNSVELGPPQAWYAAAVAAENGNRDGWHSVEPSVGVSHGGFNSGSNSDQTLFSVLSECHELPRAVSFDAATHTGNYHGGMIGGIPSSSSSNFLAQPPPNPLSYVSGHEAASGGIKMNNIGWIGLPQQNSGIQESIGKPFLRSWNQ